MTDRRSVARGLFDRHPRLQRAVGEVGEHRIGEPPHDRDPGVAIARAAFGRCAAAVPGHADAAPAAFRKSRRFIGTGTAARYFLDATISVTRPTLVSPVYRLPCLSQAM